jgi:hypothetical protein
MKSLRVHTAADPHRPLTSKLHVFRFTARTGQYPTSLQSLWLAHVFILDNRRRNQRLDPRQRSDAQPRVHDWDPTHG